MRYTLPLHSNTDIAWLQKIFPIKYVQKCQQSIDHLKYTKVYIMQAVKFMLLVYFLAKFDTSSSSLGQCQWVT